MDHSPQGRSLPFKQRFKEVKFMTAKRAILMHPQDNVCTVVEEVQPGDPVQISGGRESRTLTAIEAVPFGFKIATEEIPRGALIVKYGETIGKAGRSIAKGAMVHVHNLEGTRARGDLERREKE
jgi:altronate dehydratase small subunit